MAPKKNQPSAHKRDGIHFVNARPSSETERLSAKRLVRAHVGRWISDQTKDRSTSLESLGSSRSTHALHDSISPSSSNLTHVGSSSYTHGSRSSSYSTRPAHAIQHALPVSLEQVPQREWQPSPFPPSHASDSSESSDDASTVVTVSSNPTAIRRWHALSPIEPPISSALDPFGTHPSRFKPEIMNLCEEYCLKVLWPGLIPTRDQRKETGQLWSPLARSDPALFTSFMFASLCHRRMQWLNGSITKDSFDRELDQALELCEMESISLINEAVHDPSRAISDAVLLSVICMAHHRATGNSGGGPLRTPFNPPLRRLQWVDVYGCLRPNMVHVQGLLQLINLRGGLKNITTLGLRPTIGFSDIFTASVLCSRPVFEFWPIDPNRNGISIYALLDFDQSDVDHGFGRLRGIGITPQMAEALQAAHTYIEILKACLASGYEISLLADKRNITQHTLLSIPQATDVHAHFSHPSQPATYEACRLTALIFGVGVVFPLPAQSTPLRSLAQQLQSALSQPTASTLWSSPNTRILLLWILTLGGIAACDTPGRSFFASALGHSSRCSGLSSWPDLKQCLEMMLWYDLACDEAGEALWHETQASYATE
ncbi:Protein of unknown function DUF3468 [Penicillium capsulatum]|uniref:Transcription factor domain-containing protein n=1 Tax=Penicillium capsulatum TaxID=69766 RepID=A0A9W9LXJ7_9EURO|nr:Protein of unknown function DUF3468 [Penicillium capsulatum]KAJ6121323.1 Protein of unknown function DUF3468 [Penicillium capsulatum]